MFEGVVDRSTFAGTPRGTPEEVLTYSFVSEANSLEQQTQTEPSAVLRSWARAVASRGPLSIQATGGYLLRSS